MLSICAWISENTQSHTQEDKQNSIKVDWLSPTGIGRCARTGTRGDSTADAGMVNEKDFVRFVLVWGHTPVWPWQEA